MHTQRDAAQVGGFQRYRIGTVDDHRAAEDLARKAAQTHGTAVNAVGDPALNGWIVLLLRDLRLGAYGCQCRTKLMAYVCDEALSRVHLPLETVYEQINRLNHRFQLAGCSYVER